MDQAKPRILLIYPPFFRLLKRTYSLTSHPIGLGSLATAVRRRGAWDVRVYNADFNPDPNREATIKNAYVAETGFANYLDHLKDLRRPLWDEVRAVITAYKPTVVGICIKSPVFASARMVAKLAKEVDPGTVVIAGGAHVSTVNAEVLDCPDIDIGVVGEAELTLVELLDALAAGADLSPIRGLVFRRDGKVVRTPGRAFVEDLDSLGFAHETAPNDLQDFCAYPKSAFQYIFATRGCPFNCFFCGSRNVWTRRVRYRSPASVTGEINWLRTKLGLKRIFFSDDTFGINPNYIRDLCAAIARDCPGLRWGCEIHANVVTDTAVAQMKAAGCDLIKLGIESGSNEILQKIEKGTTIERALEACEIINRHGVRLQVFFQVGFPWETETTLNDTVAAMKKIDCDFIIFSIFTPYPGTAAFEFCRHNGLVKDDFDIALFNHQSPENHFCLNIPRDRFRQRLSEIEVMVDRINQRRRLKRLLSPRNIYRKAAEVGVTETVRRAAKVLAGR